MPLSTAMHHFMASNHQSNILRAIVVVPSPYCVMTRSVRHGVRRSCGCRWCAQHCCPYITITCLHGGRSHQWLHSQWHGDLGPFIPMLGGTRRTRRTTKIHLGVKNFPSLLTCPVNLDPLAIPVTFNIPDKDGNLSSQVFEYSALYRVIYTKGSHCVFRKKLPYDYW